MNSNVGTRTIANNDDLDGYGLTSTEISGIRLRLTDDRPFNPDNLSVECKGCGLKSSSVSHSEKIGSQGRIIITNFADKTTGGYKSFEIHGFGLHDTGKGYEGICFQEGKTGVKIVLY